MVMNDKGDKDIYTEDSEGTDECGLRVCITKYKNIRHENCWLFCAAFSPTLFYCSVRLCWAQELFNEALIY